MRSIKRFYLSIIFLCTLFLIHAQDIDRPRIGLTLSGGGAKGLAHIGVLMAIDSAGLEVHAITGTSMGAIVGSLYSIGYSGKEIEKLARSLNWNELFLSIPSYDHVSILQKEEFGKYPLQIPIEEGKVKPYTGIFEAQDIWKKFGKLYMPAYRIKDFSKFNIPFLCIATDLVTGEPVVLRSGEISTAVRASMAIPSIFTAIKYKDTKLIDGGIVNNFPVDKLNEFDIDYSIGVNMSMGLQDIEKLISPVDVLLQIAFYKDAENFEMKKELCNLYIEPEMKGVSFASFNASDSIIDIGIKVGQEYYPYFKKLADSLMAGPERPLPIGSRLPLVEEVYIDSILVEGLNSKERDIFLRQIGLTPGMAYDASDITDALELVYGTLAYRRISYTLEPLQPEHALIRFEAELNPKTFLNFDIHYNLYSGSALIAGFNSQNEFIRNSRTILKTNISENFRARLKHQQFFTGKKRRGLELSAYYEHFRFPIYQDFKEQYLYRSNFGNVDANLFQLLGQSRVLGLGIRQEFLEIQPEISVEDFTAKNNYLSSYIVFKKNTLDEPVFSHRGTNIELLASYVFNQDPNSNFKELSQDVLYGDSISPATGNYFQLNVKKSAFFPLGKKTTLFYQFASALNFKPEYAFFNYYSVGGLSEFLRNQVPFAGLAEHQVNTNSIVGFQLGLQVEPFNNIYIILRVNTALYDFIGLAPKEWSADNFLSGYSLSAAHNSIIGPIELSLLYNDQSQNFAGHITMGFAF